MPLKVHTYFPLLGQYLWMKINFVGTVQRIDDPEVLAAAEKLAQEAKTYIVYLRSNHQPPLAWDEASGYTVDIVTRGPRLADSAEGFTWDMYVPVHPYTHPVHQSVRPERELPFPDCSHWFYAAAHVAVQRVAEGLDNNKAYEVPLDQVHLVEEAHSEEWSHHAAERRKALSQAGVTYHPHFSSGEQPTPGYAPYFDRFIPLVNVGIDIENKFTGSDQLPTIYDFFEERAKLKRVLTDALDRAVEQDRLAAQADSSSSTMQPSFSQDSQDSPGGKVAEVTELSTPPEVES